MKTTLLVFPLSLLWLAPAMAGEHLVYFGTYAGAHSKGIYVSRFDSATGRLSAAELAVETKNPSFLALHPNGRYLYAVGEEAGELSAFAIAAKTGGLTLLNRRASGGGGPCHLSVDSHGECLLAANYGSGSVAALPIRVDGSLGEPTTTIQHTGTGANPERQAGPHAHFICPSPDRRFALACDLGLDRVFAYPFDARNSTLNPKNPIAANVAPGAGPRHLSFSPDGRFVYVINEINSTITAFSYEPGTAAMQEIQTISTLPPGAAAKSFCAEIAIHPTGRYLYGSNRGHDSIAVFKVDSKSGRLSSVEYPVTMGRTPRHFAIDPTGRWLLAENQGSDSVVVFRIELDSGRLKPTGQALPIGSPVCAVFTSERR